MPIYEYQCKSCGKISEELVQGFSSSKIPKCPDCGRVMERRLSSPNLVKSGASIHGKTCCGREERCETPACSTGSQCRRHEG